MTCPKCGSGSVFGAQDEAPVGARDWRKCLACGKRWDAGTAQVRTEGDGEEEADAEEPGVDADDGDDDPLALAMRDVRARRGRPRTERPPLTGAKSPPLSEAVKAKISAAVRAAKARRGATEEGTMPHMICNKFGCTATATPGRKICEAHAEKQRHYLAAYRAKKAGRPVSPKARTAPRPSADSHANANASWADWKTGLLQELVDAETKLRDKLDGIRRAKETIEAL